MSRAYIAGVLKRLRENIGLTADEVGSIIGRSGKTVNAWENGRGQPDAEMLIKLCSVYHVNNILAEFDEENNIKKSMPPLSETETELLSTYRNLNKNGQDHLMEYAEMLSNTSKYKNYPDTQNQHQMIYRAARSETNTEPEIIKDDKGLIEKLKQIPPVTNEEDL